MDPNKPDKKPGEGRLPAMAPLANPYVPFQLENSPKYEAKKGFIRGTLFPGLDLPFMGMGNTAEKPATPLAELQTMAFVLSELAQYLDTHREDKEALEMYRSFQSLYHKGVMAYTRDHGPLNHGVPTEGPYTWLDDPWPWEYAGNQEG